MENIALCNTPQLAELLQFFQFLWESLQDSHLVKRFLEFLRSHLDPVGVLKVAHLGNAISLLGVCHA